MSDITIATWKYKKCFLFFLKAHVKQETLIWWFPLVLPKHTESYLHTLCQKLIHVLDFSIYNRLLCGRWQHFTYWYSWCKMKEWYFKLRFCVQIGVQNGKFCTFCALSYLKLAMFLTKLYCVDNIIIFYKGQWESFKNHFEDFKWVLGNLCTFPN